VKPLMRTVFQLSLDTHANNHHHNQFIGLKHDKVTRLITTDTRANESGFYLIIFHIGFMGAR